MISLLLCLVAYADPVAQRAPVPVAGASVAWHELSVGMPVHEAWWVTVEARTTFSAVGASVGQRFDLARDAAGWGFELAWSAGVLVPTLDPAFALTATPAVLGGIRRDGYAFSGGLAIPVAARLSGGPQVRIPVLFELQGAGRAGPLWLGARLGAGPVFTPGTDLSMLLEPGVWIGLRAPASQ